MSVNKDNNLNIKIDRFKSVNTDYLYEIIGSYKIGNHLDDENNIYGIDGLLDFKRKEIYEKGVTYFNQIKPLIKDLLCGEKLSSIDVENADLLLLVKTLLPIFCDNDTDIIPDAVIALSLIIVRYGIFKFCSDYDK